MFVLVSFVLRKSLSVIGCSGSFVSASVAILFVRTFRFIWSYVRVLLADYVFLKLNAAAADDYDDDDDDDDMISMYIVQCL